MTLADIEEGEKRRGESVKGRIEKKKIQQGEELDSEEDKRAHFSRELRGIRLVGGGRGGRG
jgi:hypothetical protein